MRKLLFIALVFVAGLGKAQQLPQFSQFMFNQYAYNPAYAGVKPSWEAVTNNRYQWSGITDAREHLHFRLKVLSKKKIWPLEVMFIRTTLAQHVA